ncbi:MAG: M16 family metallopeptidase [Pyrinomonadaceae bacterium]
MSSPLLAILFAFALYGFAAAPCAAQNIPEPRREQLLNGLRIVLWQKPGAPDVLLKLRIHSGAVFDTAGKAGTMALLGDLLFPDQTTREYFTEELGGRLSVTTDADAINITLAGRASEFERIVEQLRNALVNPPLTAANIARLREARAKIVRETGISPMVIADRALKTRLFGDYPLGRPSAGTPDTLARIERGDLLTARQRFLNSNNATLIVIGGVDDRRAMRALRQLLGGWRQSEQIAPATFRQPEAADARTLIVDLPGAETAEIRLAARSLARSDRDYAAATLLALLARDRWQTAFPQLGKSAFFVRNEAHVLPGVFVLGASLPAPLAAGALAAARSVVASLATTPPSSAELERARTEALAVFNKQLDQPETLAELWLDVDTYKLDAIYDQLKRLNAVMPADVQRTAARLFLGAPQAAVAVGSAVLLKPDFERAGRVEIFGAGDDRTKIKTVPDKKP